jgi:hypothetical protein
VGGPSLCGRSKPHESTLPTNPYYPLHLIHPLLRHTWLEDWGPDQDISLLPDPYRTEVARAKVQKLIKAAAEEGSRTGTSGSTMLREASGGMMT